MVALTKMMRPPGPWEEAVARQSLRYYLLCPSAGRRRQLPTCLSVTLALLRRLHEVRQRRFRGIVRSQHVDIDDALERVGAQLLHTRQEIARRARDDEIDGPELLHAASHGVLQAFEITHVDVADA